MAEIAPLREEAAALSGDVDLCGKDDDCGLAREETGSTRASGRQKANREASADISELPSTRPSREVSGASAEHLPKADLDLPLAPRPKTQPCRVAAAAIAGLALLACVAAAVRAPRRAEASDGGSGALSSPDSTPRAHRGAEMAHDASAPRPTSVWALLESRELHEVATDNLMSVGQKVLTSADRLAVHSTVAAGFKNMSARLKQHAPEAAKVLDGVRFDGAQRHAVLKTMRLLSDRRVQSIGFDVAKAIRESGSKDHWVILDRIHRRLRPRVGEIRMLRDELIPSSLQALTSAGHHWDLTLSPANVQSMEDVGDAWARELGDGAAELATPSTAQMLAIFRKLGAAASPFSDEGEAESSQGIEAAGGPVRAPAEPRELAEKKALGIAAGVSEQGRYLMDVLRLSVLGKDGRAHDAPVGASALTGALSASSGPEGASSVSCSGPGMATAALLCPLKFGTQGLDALRAVVEIRVLRR